MLKSSSCAHCGAPFASSIRSALVETCKYCGSTFKKSPQEEGALVCGCGRRGVNRCALCTASICQDCSNCIGHFDLAEIMFSHGVAPRYHPSMLQKLEQRVPLTATLCVACFDSTLTSWLRTTPTT